MVLEPRNSQTPLNPVLLITSAILCFPAKALSTTHECYPQGNLGFWRAHAGPREFATEPEGCCVSELTRSDPHSQRARPRKQERW